MTAFQLKLVWAGTNPEVWRRVHVPSTATFEQLGRVIQASVSQRFCASCQFELPRQNAILIDVTEDLRIENASESFPVEEKKIQTAKNRYHSGGRSLSDFLRQSDTFCCREYRKESWKVEILVEKEFSVPIFYSPHCIGGEFDISSRLAEAFWGGEDAAFNQARSAAAGAETFDQLEADGRVRSIETDFAEEVFFYPEMKAVLESLMDTLMVEGEPTHCLTEILERLSVGRLMDLAENFDVERAAELRRADLESAVLKAVLDDHYLIYHSLHTGEKGMRLLEILTVEDSIPFQKAYCPDLMPLAAGGLLYPFYVDGRVEFYLPEEIKQEFLKIRNQRLMEDRRQEQDFNRLFKAAVHLYGKISVGELVELYNCYVPEEFKTDEEEILDMMDAFIGYNLCEYTLCGEYLCSVCMEAGDETPDVFVQPRPEAMYRPSVKEKLYRFAKSDYYDHTPVHIKFWQFLHEEVGEESVEASVLMDAVNEFLQSEKDPEEILEIFQSYEFPFASEAQEERMLRLLEELQVQTRLWTLGGHTWEEIRRKGTVQSECNVISLKTGKPLAGTDPCPCGSGKAFDQCCGQVNHQDKR